MTHAKVAVRLPPAASVSAYVAEAITAYGRETTLRELVDEMIAEHGKPEKADYAWADRVLTAARKR